MYYKEFNSIIQPINFLKNNELFCIKYKVYEGCTLCTSPFEKTEFLEPAIHITLNNFLNNVDLTEIIKSRLQNFHLF